MSIRYSFPAVISILGLVGGLFLCVLLTTTEQRSLAKSSESVAPLHSINYQLSKAGSYLLRLENISPRDLPQIEAFLIAPTAESSGFLADTGERLQRLATADLASSHGLNLKLERPSEILLLFPELPQKPTLQFYAPAANSSTQQSAIANYKGNLLSNLQHPKAYRE